eukprot:336485-Amphidinium_carterae.3
MCLDWVREVESHGLNLPPSQGGYSQSGQFGLVEVVPWMADRCQARLGGMAVPTQVRCRAGPLAASQHLECGGIDHVLGGAGSGADSSDQRVAIDVAD